MTVGAVFGASGGKSLLDSAGGGSPELRHVP